MSALALAIAAIAGAPATTAAANPMTDCVCSSSPAELFLLPSNVSGAPAAQIRSQANTSLCWGYAKSAGGTTCDGVCVMLGDCGDSAVAMTWRWDRNGTWLRVASPASLSGWCLDENLENHYLQAYPSCNEGDTHQLWRQDGFPNGRVHELWSGKDFCMAERSADLTCNVPPPPPPPRPRSAFCPTYHPITAAGLYDPSGPLLDDEGWWHVWEDAGGWSHYVSRDLLHWDTGGPSTGFGGLTGSVAVTPSGTFAFFPEGNQKGVDMAPSTDAANLTTWGKGARVITVPEMAGANFRDPLRAFKWSDGAWYVGVGCNNKSNSADLCLFQAADDRLSQFTFAGSMFTATETYGRMENGGVWRNDSGKAIMMECPDIFPLGGTGKWMAIGSLYSTNQWWVGTVAGSPPRFSPESVGILDYGYGYAAKTGTTRRALPTDRRVVFGFTGWSEPTAATGCGRALIIPRDVTLGPDGASPRINPIPELQALRVPGSEVTVPSLGPVPEPLTPGPAVWVSAQCSFSAVPAAGALFAHVLATADGSEFTEVGVDFSGAVGGWTVPALYANHSACCGGRDAMVQTAPVADPALLGGHANLTILVDGGLIEVFLNGVVALTALVNPTNATAPAARVNTLAATVAAGAAACSGASWAVAPVPAPV